MCSAGEVGPSGPDLTGVGRKGSEQIYRSIAAPSAEIAPEFVPYTVATRDGRVLAGVVRAKGADAIRVTDTDAKTTTAHDAVRSTRSAPAERRSCPLVWSADWEKPECVTWSPF